MVIGRAADIVVVGGQRQLRLLGYGLVVQPMLEDGLEALEGMGAQAGSVPCGKSPPVDLLRRLGPGAQDAEAGTVRRLGMVPGGQHRGDELGRGRPRFLGPAHEPLGRPIPVLAVGFKPVFSQRGRVALLIRTPMTGHPLAPVEALHGIGREAHLQRPFNQLIGYGVVTFDLPVVVDVHPDLFPLGIDGWGNRQGLEGRAVQGLEERATRAGSLFERPLVERVQPLAYGFVQLAQGEKGSVAQAGQNPAFDHLDADLDLGLIARLAHSGGQYADPIMGGPVLVSGIDVRFIPMRLGNA